VSAVGEGALFQAGRRFEKNAGALDVSFNGADDGQAGVCPKPLAGRFERARRLLWDLEPAPASKGGVPGPR
jgi:hypothetical protein